MARSLVESLSGHFDPEQYKDAFRIALQELITRKATGEARNARRRKPEAKVVDLMAALEESLQAARSAKAGSSAKSTGTAGRSRSTTARAKVSTGGTARAKQKASPATKKRRTRSAA